MRRRDLLKATGLAAVADFEAITKWNDPSLSIEETVIGDLISRIPEPSDTPDGRYGLTIARRLDQPAVPVDDLIATADAHASLVSTRVALTMGLGVSSDAALEALGRRGFQQSETIEGRPLLVRRSRYKQQVAVVDGETLVVARGPELPPVTSLVRAVAVRRSEPLEDRLPVAHTVLDRLGPGEVLSVSPTARRSESEGLRAVATGECLSLRAPERRLRTVIVYESPAAAESALEAIDGGRATGIRITREGRAVVREESVPERALPVTMD